MAHLTGAQPWRRPLQEIGVRFAGTAVAEGLGGVTAGLEAGEHFEALRAIRRLFPVETLILAEPDSPGTGDGLVGEPDQA